MIISLCIPVMNRLHDLIKTMPYVLETANASPPVEIVVLDYCSTDGLKLWFDRMMQGVYKADENCIRYIRYSGKSTFHRAHAFNLSILASTGDYAVLMGADAIPSPEYVATLRRLIADGYNWMHAKDVCGIVAFEKQEFIAAGGYDERFELYGPEDREIEERMLRRGVKLGIVPKGLMRVIRTTDEDKVKNYDIKANKGQMSRMMRPILEESRLNNTMIANMEGWGRW